MEQFQFNYTDILRFSRKAFSVRRIGIHLIGILLAYFVYEILFYLTLYIAEGEKVQVYWKSFGLLPVPPFGSSEFTPLISTTLWIGLILFAFIFYFSSIMASKITIEQLRGDEYYSVGNSFKFLQHHWKTVIGTFLGLLFILSLIFMIPIGVGLLGKIPIIGKTFLVASSFFIPFAFIFGLLIAYIIAVMISGLFLVPAVISTTNADSFETIYQLFAVLWNQPWRFIGYGILLFILKLVLVPIWGIFCGAGFIVLLLPIHYLHPTFIEQSLGNANLWLGESLQKLSLFFDSDVNTIIGINITQDPILTTSATISGILITFTLIAIAALIIAYLFSIASVGTTVIYTIIRNKIDGLNLIDTIGNVAPVEPPPILIGDE
ncbi:hypothetical protein C6497_03070 [Candidatus Poribacteria bacterium]|nr:MAG: hypothetical protein C6497_03070 [Candidatus Poribacteria bacterium]